ncbi:Cd(II)/Pb(II)-responsive transcriptional regulator [Rodentibacter trehalosifermentans]|uniref:MerR family transcriptional regulator n=1 Tax=Rodentibacter trehalosifermentans TaxID=1908263 RepID=A0A1V3IYK8_9PAST|nr:Cd(II)/Pb(II)-responsive transcriptional regulator [Rodentibacter trehalosifermentans]OOF45278.1 MerR family transcriptional regulator [Rodentibacter trehalosifermentans]OOF47466.1 MerR family transcriptional regulator [Rodentibacter trehalosifermentans]OOF53142.1 MerR family transcriptional regulator [Rodentibacter trehalosifermentans]
MKIGQLAKALNCTVETIRFYEKQGLVPPPQRTAGNFRQYNEEHLQRLSFICHCRSLDLSLNEIKTLIALEHHQEQRTEEMNKLLDRHIKEIAKRIHELAHLRMKLIELREKSTATDEDPMKLLLQHSGVRFVRW